ncbi:MAG: glycosyltransferase [Opitutaceae bacterium]|nr:glycosyltransferase [Opitutaceae bacterium]
MSTPAISVIVPVYNAAHYLAAAITSVQAQTFRDFEIIAVDDGSTDDSKAVLDRLAAADARLQVVSRPNTGIVGALNDGLAAARGEFVARMDADDLSLPPRFARQLAFLHTHPECVCVGSAFLYMDASGSLLKECRRPTDHATIERELLAGNGGAIIHPAAMFRRAAVERAGRYRPEAQWIEDLDLYLRLARRGHLANLPEVLFHYRLHEQSVNFTRNQGRQERKLAVLAEAHAARGLPFDRAAHAVPDFKSAISADDLRDFAVTSLRFGPRGRPLYYALRALRAEPRCRHSWSTLAYILKHRLGLFGRAA